MHKEWFLPMTLFLLLLCLFNLFGLVVLAYAVRKAPNGFEDGNGFHSGDQPLDASAQQELAFALRKA